jgi:hypothetical protein
MVAMNKSLVWMLKKMNMPFIKSIQMFLLKNAGLFILKKIVLMSLNPTMKVAISKFI